MKKRSELFGNQKGKFDLKRFLISAGVMIVVIFLVYQIIVVPFMNYLSIKDNINQPGLKGVYYTSLYKVADFLGYDTGAEYIKQGGFTGFLGYFWNKLMAVPIFIGHLIIGLLAGIWIFLVSQISMALRNMFGKKGYVNRWQMLIAGNAWKVIAIGIGFAILFEIPFVNRFVQIITFEVLGVNWFIRSIIVAFYIGLGPAWIEDYTKYKLRIKAEKAIIAAQARAKLERASMNA